MEIKLEQVADAFMENAPSQLSLDRYNDVATPAAVFMHRDTSDAFLAYLVNKAAEALDSEAWHPIQATPMLAPIDAEPVCSVVADASLEFAMRSDLNAIQYLIIDRVARYKEHAKGSDSIEEAKHFCDLLLSDIERHGV